MKCQHPGCQCRETRVERAGKRYCSERCAELEMSGRHQPQCPCGHEECSAG